MSSLSLLLTSVNPNVPYDPFTLVMVNLFGLFVQSVVVAFLATLLPLVILSIDVVAGSYKPTRWQRFKEATIFSRRAWTLSFIYVGVAAFLLSFATSILSVAAQMDPLKAAAIVFGSLLLGGAVVLLMLVVIVSLKRRFTNARENEREHGAGVM